MRKRTLTGLATLLCLASTQGWAGTLYKCTASDGTLVYANSNLSGNQCEVVMNFSMSASQESVTSEALHKSATSLSVPPAVQTPSVTATNGPRRTVRGEVYSYMKDGVRHYSSRRPSSSTEPVRTLAYSYIERCYACGTTNAVNFSKVPLRNDAYSAEIAAAAREFGVDEAIVRAVIHAESAFNPLVVSHAGAQGLMQLMPATARRFGVSDSFDAAQNIRGGVQYLSWLLRRFNGNLTLAAAGYNAGEGAVDRYGGVPPYRETQHYVQRVAQLVERYRNVSSPAS